MHLTVWTLKRRIILAVIILSLFKSDAIAAGGDIVKSSLEGHTIAAAFLILIILLIYVIIANRRISKKNVEISMLLDEYKKFDLTRKMQQEYQVLISEAIQMVYKSDDPTANFDGIFERIARRTKLKRICIFEDVSESAARMTYEWKRDAGGGLPAEFNYEKVFSWKNYINDEVMIDFPACESMPDDIKEYIIGTGAACIFALPMFINNSYSGFVCFEGESYDNLWEEYIAKLLFPIAGIISNAIEKKRNTVELKKLNDTKDKFFSILAHDLRSPLSSFAFLIDVIIRKELDDETKDETLGSIKKSVDNCLNMVESILRWARMQRGDILLEIEKFDVKSVVDENIELLSQAANNKNITLSANVEELTVSADRSMALTIVRNLINNAIKFTPNGGKIEISSLKKNGMAQITVLDNGKGMSKKVMDKLFRLGEKIVSYGTSGEKGSGFGLILCHDFVTRNGGKIWAESEEGNGSKFIFTLPLAEGR